MLAGGAAAVIAEAVGATVTALCALATLVVAGGAVAVTAFAGGADV
ncbi:hypothetical protein ACN082_04280 [Rothia sp. CCM 9417]